MSEVGVASTSANMSIASHQEDEVIAKNALQVRKVVFGKAASQHVLHELSLVGHFKARVVIWHGVEHVGVVLHVGQPEINKNCTDHDAGDSFFIAELRRSFPIIVSSISDNCTGCTIMMTVAASADTLALHIRVQNWRTYGKRRPTYSVISTIESSRVAPGALSDFFPPSTIPDRCCVDAGRLLRQQAAQGPNSTGVEVRRKTRGCSKPTSICLFCACLHVWRVLVLMTCKFHVASF